MKKYQIIYADPPWEVKRGPDWGSNETSRILTYPTMSIDKIKEMPINRLTDNNCRLFL
jgi:N6-adenosine-specific RNA methylase IME4